MRSALKQLRRVSSVLCIAVATGCGAIGDARAVLEQIFALQGQLEEQFPGETIRVTESTTGQLSIDLVNSRMAALPADERAALTRKIAMFVRRHYGRASAIQTISVVFKSEAGAAGFTVSSADPTDYAIGELDEAPQPVHTRGTPAGDSARGATTSTSSADSMGAATTMPPAKPKSRWNSY